MESDFTLRKQCIFTPSTWRSCYLLPPEELLEEVVRLRLSAPISLLTRVRRSVDILFLKEVLQTKRQKCIDYSKNRHLSSVTNNVEIKKKSVGFSSFNFILYISYLLMDCAVSFLGEEGEERRRFC